MAGTGSTPPRTLHVEHCMGTAFTIDIRDRGRWTDAVREVIAWLHDVDAVFSTYRADSDISRIRRGELRPDDARAEVTEVLDLCAELHVVTDGYFSAMPQGRLDPTGLVKGWAIERASRILRGHGSADHAVNGGGDIQLAGEPSPGEPWSVGIVDPHDGSRVLTVVTGRDFAVATSGTAERGAHIVDPFTGRPATGLAASTVVGASLTHADVFATAAFVMGAAALRWIDGVPSYETLQVAVDGTLRVSRGWAVAAAAAVDAEGPDHTAGAHAA